MSYRYRVRDPLGNIHEGHLEAATQDATAQQLRQSGLIILQLEDEEESTG